MVSTDKGLTQLDTYDKEIMSLYFFMHDNRVEHARKVYNIIDILSEIGGLGTSLVSFVGIFGTMYNTLKFANHIVYLLYFVNDDDQDADDELEFDDNQEDDQTPHLDQKLIPETEKGTINAKVTIELEHDELEKNDDMK